jgi:hypothetical protein
MGNVGGCSGKMGKGMLEYVAGRRMARTDRKKLSVTRASGGGNRQFGTGERNRKIARYNT